ncbi:hypothetical protein Pelo_1998 [Pelomyxa schiedti]|nr:hypothetical protein Pelo_1998 [Pelomyxa schiedti]
MSEAAASQVETTEQLGQFLASIAHRRRISVATWQRAVQGIAVIAVAIALACSVVWFLALRPLLGGAVPLDAVAAGKSTSHRAEGWSLSDLLLGEDGHSCGVEYYVALVPLTIPMVLAQLARFRARNALVNQAVNVSFTVGVL